MSKAFYFAVVLFLRPLDDNLERGITQFYLPPTHEPYLPLLPSRMTSPPFGWYSLCRPVLNLFFYQYTALSSRAEDGHQMYSGGSVVGKALLIDPEILPPLL